MGQIKNEKTRQKVEFLKNVIDEILFLEEYANECKKNNVFRQNHHWGHQTKS